MKNHRRIFLSVFLILLLPSCSFLPIQHDTTFYGLIIGINYDTNPNVADLNWCEADADSIHSSLENKGWDPSEMTLLLGSAATKFAITENLKNFINQAGENDYILVYFSGHGVTILDTNGDEIDNTDEAIVPEDALPSDPLTLISDDELGSIFSTCKTKKGIFILDCCHSGGIINKSLILNDLKPKYIKGITPKGSGLSGDLDIINFPVMTASGQNELSYEWGPLKHGVFTYYILEGLYENADANNDDFITVRELFKYAEEEIEYSIFPQNPKLRLPMDFIDILVTRTR